MPDPDSPIRVALSVRQPWAALLAAGAKTLEIRSWLTHYRGPVLIHAAKLPDRRSEAWEHVASPEIDRFTNLIGGIIAEAHVVGCRAYNTYEAFAADRDDHLNDPAWFVPPCLYGFEFRDARPVPFVPVVGQMKFFTVKGFPPS